MFLPGVKEGRLLAFCHHLICSRNRNDPHCHERSVFSSFEECQQILKHEVAGHVHYRTDNHQHKGESHPQRSRLSRLHRWFPQPEHIQPRTVDEGKDDCTTRRSPAHFRAATPVSESGYANSAKSPARRMDSASPPRSRCRFNALKRRRGACFVP
jgi:hypothetical protein